MRCPAHVAGNRLDLVTTDAPDIVDVLVDTPLVTSDHCLVSCVLRVEQPLQKYNIRSYITNGAGVAGAAVTSLTVLVLQVLQLYR